MKLRNECNVISAEKNELIRRIMDVDDVLFCGEEII